jgi:hypothetical protein
MNSISGFRKQADGCLKKIVILDGGAIGASGFYHYKKDGSKKNEGI